MYYLHIILDDLTFINTQKRPHVVWKDVHRQTYLSEMLRSEGRGDFNAETCVDCKARNVKNPHPAIYRCQECFVPDLVCASCCVQRHRTHPFHRIEVRLGPKQLLVFIAAYLFLQKWDLTDTVFRSVTLRSLGAFIQLNHSGTHCDNPKICHQSMLVLHVNGIHDTAIKFCGCTRAIPQHIQLLRRQIYPALQLTIQTCVTFELLHLLHTLALTTKSNTYDFYRALEKMTSNTGLNAPKSRYRALLRMVLQWRHLKLLKRGGRGHELTGAMGTATGKLSIICPSCPRPGVNLDAGWTLDSVPLAMRSVSMRSISYMDT